jgi:formamidopyrimidine-DNA glycosylase
MTGRLLWLVRSQPVGIHTRVRLFLDRDWELRFDDQRTFGKMWYVPQGVAVSAVIKGLAGMGAEPLAEEFAPEYLAQKVKNSGRSIKTLLLDQRVVAGIGNIYADEALFLAHIHPCTLGKNLTMAQITSLHGSIVSVLTTGLEYGGTTFSNFQDVNGKQGNYLDRAWVFRRTGQSCRLCGTKIARLKIGGRSSHYCPRCQPSTEG